MRVMIDTNIRHRAFEGLCACSSPARRGTIDPRSCCPFMKLKLLSPKSDLIFKLIFGDQRNIDILTAFLRAVLDLPEDEYERVTIIDPSLKRDSIRDKLGILDVKIHTRTGKAIDVEIQVLSFPQMRERIVFYAAKMITEQIGKGDPYTAIKKVISIVITDYTLIPESARYHNRYVLHDRNTGSTFTDILEVNVLELPKLPGKNDETALWDWMLFLKSDREEDLFMLSERNPQIKKAVAVLAELSADEETRLLNDAREKALRDEAARLDGAKQEGLKEGLKEGLEKGLEKGARKAQLKIARNMLRSDLPVETIAAYTGLSLAEIDALREET